MSSARNSVERDEIMSFVGTASRGSARLVCALLFTLLALIGCGDAGSPTCQTGAEACGCRHTETPCDTGLFCTGEVCRRPRCTQGEEGCACFGNYTCARRMDGSWNVCQDGLCRAPACQQGTLACGCNTDGTCATGLECQSADGAMRCQLPNCRVGDLNCGCRADRTCNASADGATLVCLESRCQAATCAAGALNCACRADYSCDSGLLCGGDGRCRSIDCTPGTISCTCRSGGMCDASLACGSDNRCRDPGCTEGAERCGCRADRSCDVTTNDGGASSLLCRAGRCARENCSVGAEGCACLTGNTCTAPGVSCLAGRCVSSSCTPGARNCPCNTGRTCNSGLACSDSSICVETLGLPGGACFTDRTCVRGNRCDSGRCTPCLLGAATCGCFESGGCNAGLACVTGVCVSEVSSLREPPTSPVCYSPCREDLHAADGTVTQCDADGLMPRCLGGSSCTNGSCVATGATLPTCERDVQCPDFQSCIRGHCFSECTSDTQCSPGTGCYRKVCRLPCTTSHGTCPSGTHCESRDGQSGFCMPVRDPEGTPRTSVDGRFTLDVTELRFSNTTTTGRFVLRNESSRPRRFTVTKTEHTAWVGTASPARESTAPLPALQMGSCAVSTSPTDCPSTTVVRSLDIPLAAGASIQLQLSNAATAITGAGRWEGVVTVHSDDLGDQRVTIFYQQRPEGQWSGSAYYFGNFRDDGLDAWITDRTSDAALSRVRNAFMARWGAFRSGVINYNEVRAMLAATVRGDLPDRAAGCSQAVCYPLSSTSGVALQVYTDNTDNTPVPSGVTELPIAMNLRTGATARTLQGAIVSQRALQYPGNPAVTLGFATDPTVCGTPLRGNCVSFLGDLSASIRTGARYYPATSDTACGAQFRRVLTPWLVPGFQVGTVADPSVGTALAECRDTSLPFTGTSPSVPLNPFLAGSNPVADGRSRGRAIELVDGALVDNRDLVIIFRERMDTYLGTSDRAGFRAYGVMVLQRTATELLDTDFVGNTPTDTRTPPANALAVSCNPSMLGQLYRSTTPPTLGASNAREIATAMLDGTRPGVASPTVAAPGRIHYYCEETGIFDGGADLARAVACPAGSPVTYFLIDRDNAQIAGEPCNADHTCGGRLASWRDGAAYNLSLDPVWRCTSASAVFCDDNRFDLRSGKTFYEVSATQPAFVPMANAIDSAFRYRTRFRTRSGSAVGFAPQQCVLGATSIPYCYAPSEIEAVRDRVDCLLAVFTSQYSALDAALQTRLRNELAFYFAYRNRTVPGAPLPVTDDGFERLYAQTLIMLGDDAYTRAFASRFDLAGSRLTSFAGSRFEQGGIDLSGAAGGELYALYQSQQYYQLVLDRFFRASPLLWGAIGAGPSSPQNFVSQETVVAYFDRVIRASVQKSRAASEIAKRYQRMARPDLARTVIERGYNAAYLESVILSRMLLSAVEVAERAKRDQIRAALDVAQRTFDVALSEMRESYTQSRDARNIFGFEPDYVPFPALDPGDTNAFTRVFAAARTRLAAARSAEDAALSSDRSYESDSAAFQGELVRLRNNYDGQLSEICGTFTGDDGRVYPATPKYAEQSSRTRTLRDPCGLVGNGQLYDALGQVEVARLDLRGALDGYDRLFNEVEIERQRVSMQCMVTVRLADYQWQAAGTTNNLQASIESSQLTMTRIRRGLDQARDIANLTKCSVGLSTDCPMAGIAIGLIAAANLGANIAQTVVEGQIADQQQAIRDIQRDTARFTTLSMCDSAQVESNARVRTLMLRLKDLDLDALRQEYRTRLAAARVSGLRNQATRHLAEQEEAEELAINSEAARNDPNVRIYRNDAIITADRTFEDALQEAYRATRVFEYYSSQSYGRFDTLYLVRLVGRGDYSLERYLSELENAYEGFREVYGVPSTRVAVLSLRDDILAVPRSEGGRALTQTERIARFRDTLSNGTLLDGNGYLTIPFTTALAQLSPLTRNHKILYVEAEVIGSNIGDPVGRVYLRQTGTGLVRPVVGDPRSYRLPERTAVVDTFFNGVRTFGPDVYRNDRLRDRPFINSYWEFVFNQRDEAVNQDIDLRSLADVAVYVYYTDFTAF